MKRVKRFGVPLALSVVGVLSLLPAPANAAPSNSEWIQSLILSDGAIARDIQPWMNGHPGYVSPYWSNLAALGLARTGNAADLRAAWDWLSWYQDHMSASGHVRNEQVLWDLSGSSPVFTYDPDPMNEWFSTVGNAGTFLIALREAYVQSGNDTAKLSQYRTGIQKAVAAIQSTMDADGLCWQNPRIRTKLLMDQVEAYTGLRRASLVANALGDGITAKTASGMADRIQDAIGTMWIPSRNMYAKEKDENGNLVATTWNRYYMDSTAQAWVVAFGQMPPQKPLIGGGRANDLVDRFSVAWPEWSDPYFTVSGGDPRVTGTGDGAINFWPMIGNAFNEVNRRSEGVAGVNAIDAAAISADRTWPFTVGHAGEIIRVRGS